MTREGIIVTDVYWNISSEVWEQLSLNGSDPKKRGGVGQEWWW
ncbi:MAG: hypothetical protein WBL68_03405 [Nitrososphaeraceae archaeon]